jgi:hypothetical protein
VVLEWRWRRKVHCRYFYNTKYRRCTHLNIRSMTKFCLLIYLIAYVILCSWNCSWHMICFLCLIDHNHVFFIYIYIIYMNVIGFLKVTKNTCLHRTLPHTKRLPYRYKIVASNTSSLSLLLWRELRLIEFNVLKPGNHRCNGTSCIEGGSYHRIISLSQSTTLGDHNIYFHIHHALSWLLKLRSSFREKIYFWFNVNTTFNIN